MEFLVELLKENDNEITTATLSASQKDGKIQEKTGNQENFVEIYINNFKIFFNKGVPKFKKCDTIRTYKKMKLFSNYYIPIEIVKITNFEVNESFRIYAESELIEKITKELQNELNQNLNLRDFCNIQEEVTSETDENGVTVKVVYLTEEKIGTKEWGKEYKEWKKEV